MSFWVVVIVVIVVVVVTTKASVAHAFQSRSYLYGSNKATSIVALVILPQRRRAVGRHEFKQQPIINLLFSLGQGSSSNSNDNSCHENRDLHTIQRIRRLVGGHGQSMKHNNLPCCFLFPTTTTTSTESSLALSMGKDGINLEKTTWKYDRNRNNDISNDDEDNNNDKETLTPQQKDDRRRKRSRRRNRVPSQALKDLFATQRTVSFRLPYRCALEETIPLNKDKDNKNKSSSQQAYMELRLLQLQDIPILSEMCYDEYGNHDGMSSSNNGLLPTMTSTSSRSSLDKQLQVLVKSALDNLGDVFLRPFVQLALLAKWTLCTLEMAQCPSSRDGSTATSSSLSSSSPLPNNHVVLVLTLVNDGETNKKDNNNNHDLSSSLSLLDGHGQEVVIVGWVDLSRHYVRPERTPNIFPFPELGRQQQTQPKEPWITNLLVAPQYRGQGWSKVLLGGCEAVARSWLVQEQQQHEQQQQELLNTNNKHRSTSTMYYDNKDSIRTDTTSTVLQSSSSSSLLLSRPWRIHLHCDANPISGQIPQQLYLSLGYKPLQNDKTDRFLSEQQQQQQQEKQQGTQQGTNLDGYMMMTMMTSKPESKMTCGSCSIYVIEGVPLLYLRKIL